MQFAKELTANEKAIISLIEKDELLPSSEIAKILKLTEKEVDKIIDKLNKGGYLTGTSTTNKGDAAIEEGTKVDNIEVKYRYDWRPNVSADDNSRDFCKELMSKTKAQSGWLTFAEIEALDNGQGLDVWSSRGGWWNKDGKANVPYCRHNWYQVLVTKK
jgi:DNA-binding Lrp family transcriptional regulator